MNYEYEIAEYLKRMNGILSSISTSLTSIEESLHKIAFDKENE
jgi:hypothetical protein